MPQILVDLVNPSFQCKIISKLEHERLTSLRTQLSHCPRKPKRHFRQTRVRGTFTQMLLLQANSSRLSVRSSSVSPCCHLYAQPLLLPAKSARRVAAHAAPVAAMEAVAVAAPAHVADPARSPQGFDTLSMAYTRAMKDCMGWEGRPYDYDYSRYARATCSCPSLACEWTFGRSLCISLLQVLTAVLLMP